MQCFALGCDGAAWCLSTSELMAKTSLTASIIPHSPKLEVGFSRGNRDSFISPERWREEQASASLTLGDPKSFWR